MRILITGAGGPAAISVWKSLGEAHTLIMGDMDPCATGLYLVPPAQRLILPRGDATDFVDRLLKACKDYKINLLIPTVDAELVPISLRRQAFEREGVHVALAPTSLLRMTRDKSALLAFADGVVPVPRSSVWDASVAVDSLSFPSFAKPRAGSGSRDLYMLNCLDDLMRLPRDGSFLVQEWLPGEEYSVDTYVTQKGDVIAAVPRVRMKTDSGIAVTARTAHHQDVIDLTVKLARHVGVRYVANVQFRRAVDGTPKLLEINPRFPGTLPITGAAGVNIPRLLVQDVQGHPMPQTPLPFKEVLVVRYWTEHFETPQAWQAMEQQRQAESDRTRKTSTNTTLV
jgi:carbamoyl-phosphate synthase large subunit